MLAVVVPVALGLIALSIFRGRRKALQFFQERNPDRAIADYHTSMSRVPNGKAMAAYLSGFAAVLYGQFDRAREELAAVNWASFPPMYQGCETSVHSLLAIFEARDYRRALSLAQEARELCDVSDAFPGSKAGKASLQANIDVCELLSGNCNPELLDRLSRSVKKLPGVAPAVPAWALAVYYRKLGQDAVAEEYLAVVRRFAPHCVCLNELRSRA